MITVVFHDLEEYLDFRDGHLSILADLPDGVCDPRTKLGEPAREFTDENGVGSGRAYASHHFTAEEAAILQMAGAEVRVGGVDGPIFGSNTAP